MIRFFAFLFLTVLFTNMSQAETPEPAPIRHIVCFKFSEKATPEKIAMVEKAFAELPSKIPGIKAYEWGTNISKEGKDKGFTHCFQLTFASQKDLDEYIPHPAHKEFIAKLDGLIADVFVIDYTVH
ncbi:MAG: Dabb family protein [Akkermansiaceae bacterium]|jgi:hypothetical protein|nr:Dabb family protein [Akkermansiaceae bacterium]